MTRRTRMTWRMNERAYLCRVPWTGCVVVLKEGDYRYARNNERIRRVPDPDNNMVLLAQGTWREMNLYKNLMGDLTNVS